MTEEQFKTWLDRQVEILKNCDTAIEHSRTCGLIESTIGVNQHIEKCRTACSINVSQDLCKAIDYLQRKL